MSDKKHFRAVLKYQPNYLFEFYDVAAPDENTAWDMIKKKCPEVCIEGILPIKTGDFFADGKWTRYSVDISKDGERKTIVAMAANDSHIRDIVMRAEPGCAIEAFLSKSSLLREMVIHQAVKWNDPAGGWMSGVYTVQDILGPNEQVISQNTVVILQDSDQNTITAKAGQIEPVYEGVSWALYDKAFTLFFERQLRNEEIPHNELATRMVRLGLQKPEAFRDEMIERIRMWVEDNPKSTLPSNTVISDDTTVVNTYVCPTCNHKWEDVWTCGCDDDCSQCGTRHISPVNSASINS